MNHSAHTPDAAAVDVSFSFACCGARSVCLAIFFNEWLPPSSRKFQLSWSEDGSREQPMVRELVRFCEMQSGLWCGKVSMRPGWFEYLFLVDGEWMLDPQAPRECPHGEGDLRSARFVEPIVPPETPRPPSKRVAVRRPLAAVRRLSAA